MAKYKKKPQEVEENQIEEKQEVKVEIPKKKQLPMSEYTIKNRVKVGGKWKEKKDKIKLTKEGAEFFRSKRYI